MIDTEKPVENAILVGIQLPGVNDAAHAASLGELTRLVETLGFVVSGTISQRRDGIGGMLLGKGKLAELARLTGGTGVAATLATRPQSKARDRFETTVSESETQETSDDEDDDEVEPSAGEAPKAARLKPELVIVDHELSPSQARNLERATGARVLDRTGVIVEIFHRHAHSREAKIQVEMARLRYVSPRLRESLAGGGRRQGPGAGETDIDLDRRKVRDRLAELKTSLEHVQRDGDQRRSQRGDQLRVALVGYTNAGKSSLMRALTGSDVMVADKLFATLDTTVRALQPETRPRILVADTVGFIKDLPHDLVASFRSTLAEALEASLLLFVVDASDPAAEMQLEVSRAVLAEIGGGGTASRLVMNKADRLSPAEIETVRVKHPDAVFSSSTDAEGLVALRETIVDHFEVAMVEQRFRLPYADDRLLGDIYASVRVLSQDFDAEGRILAVRGLPATIARLGRMLRPAAPADTFG